MTAKERLHEIIDEMHEDQAVGLLYDLERSQPALTDQDKASIERGLQDSRAGRTLPHSEVAAKYGRRA